MFFNGSIEQIKEKALFLFIMPLIIFIIMVLVTMSVMRCMIPFSVWEQRLSINNRN